MKTFDFPQYSPEWWQARRGVPTASNFDKLVTPKTGKLSAQAADYICQLVGEKFDLAYPRMDTAVSAAMQHGTDTEAEARRWFELETGQDVLQVGFCLSECGRFGCSPDGLIGEDGGLELKCPQPKTQVGYLVSGGLPSEYRAQVHGSLIVTGRKSWVFLSYCPGLPPLMIHVLPDGYTQQLRAVLEAFQADYDRTLALITSLGQPAEEAA